MRLLRVLRLLGVASAASDVAGVVHHYLQQVAKERAAGKHGDEQAGQIPPRQREKMLVVGHRLQRYTKSYKKPNGGESRMAVRKGVVFIIPSFHHFNNICSSCWRGRPGMTISVADIATRRLVADGVVVHGHRGHRGAQRHQNRQHAPQPPREGVSFHHLRGLLAFKQVQSYKKPTKFQTKRKKKCSPPLSRLDMNKSFFGLKILKTT